MAKTITTKYGTVINVDGLTPEQVAKVRAISENNGAYGSKGAALAKSLQAKNKGGTTTPTNTKVAGAPNLGIDGATGQVNPGQATTAITNSVQQDYAKNFESQNPTSQTDASGNTQNINFDPVTGKTTITQNAGAGLTAANNAFTTAASGLANGGRQAATDAAYGYITKDYAQNKAREMEAAKQELAQRGIPIDANSESLWSKTVQGIDQKYQSLDDQAKNQALTAGNQYYATDASAVQALGNTVNTLSPTFTAFQGGAQNTAGNYQQLLQTVAGFDAAKYAVDKDYKAKMDQIAVQRLAASKVGSGGSSGGGDIILG